MNNLWKTPSKIKILEALGALADGRVEIDGNHAKVFSSSRGKFYTVTYDGKKAIMTNDNASFWQGTLGYPAIAYLLLRGELQYDTQIAQAFKDIPWKDWNTKFKNNYEKTINAAQELAMQRGVDVEQINTAIEAILQQIKERKFEWLGARITPPKGY